MIGRVLVVDDIPSNVRLLEARLSAEFTMRVPVVMVTALDRTTAKVQGLEAGADDFLTKPADKRADGALYVAKRGGRNRVVASAAWPLDPR